MKIQPGLIRLWAALGALQALATIGVVVFAMITAAPACPTPEEAQAAYHQPEYDRAVSGDIPLQAGTADDFAQCADATVLHIPEEELIVGEDGNAVSGDPQRDIRAARAARDADFQRCLATAKHDREVADAAVAKVATAKAQAAKKNFNRALSGAQARRANPIADMACRFDPKAAILIALASALAFALATLIGVLAIWVSRGFASRT